MKNILIALVSLFGSLWAAYPQAALAPGFAYGAIPQYVNRTNIQVGETGKVFYLRDRYNSWDIVGTNSWQLYSTRTYTNGIDVGAFGTNAAYGIAYVYAIDRERSNKGIAPAFMLSTDGTNGVTFTNTGSTNPQIRLYTTARRVASIPVYSADGTGDFAFAPFSVSRAGNLSTTRFYLSNRFTKVLVNAGGNTNTTYTFIDLTNFLPRGATAVHLGWDLGSLSTTNAYVSFRGVGDSALVEPTHTIAVSNTGSVRGSGVTTVALPRGARAIYYLVSASTADAKLNVLGWDEELD